MFARLISELSEHAFVGGRVATSTGASSPIRKRQRLWLGCIATVTAVAAGCGSADRKPSEDEPFSGGAHRTPNELSSLRAAYIQGVQRPSSDAFLVKEARGVLVAPNRTQRIVSDFGASGVTVRSDKRADGREPSSDWSLSVSTQRYGCAGDLRPLTGGEARADENRVTYERAQKDGAPIVEWYVNGPMGLEHGFELASPPACVSGRDSDVNIDVALDGNLEAGMSTDRDAVVLRDAKGKVVAHYADLFVRDAQNRILPSHFEVSGRKVRIAFDAAGATYPLTVDPLIATLRGKLFASEGREGDEFAQSVSISGNTAVVGAPLQEDATGTLLPGAAYVFARNGNTWTEQVKLTSSEKKPGDEFGVSVAISGSTIVVGASDAGASLDPAGAVYVFGRTGTTWTEQAKVTGVGTTPGARFGSAVALSGNTMVVGAFSDSQGVQLAGSAYIFARSGSTWTQQAKLLGDTPLQLFGATVAVSADTALIGMPSLRRLGVPPPQDAVRVYVRIANTTWALQATLTPSEPTPSSSFGAALALSGDVALVGAPLTDAGSAYVFARTGATWAQEAKITPPDGQIGDGFGTAVALSGPSALIGAPSQQVRGIANRGVTYAYERNGGRWTNSQKLDPSVESTAQSFFGARLAMDRGVAFVGAPRSGRQGPESGAAYAFTQARNGIIGPWTFQQDILPEGASPTGAFGSAVSIVGDTALMGAPTNTEQGPSAGAAYVFVRTGATWTRQRKLLASDGADIDAFGSSVVLSGNFALIGAPEDGDLGPRSGSVYVFVRNGDTWTEQTKLLASDGKPLDGFGSSVAMSGNTAIIGASRAGAQGPLSGAAYVFTVEGATWTEQSKLVADDGAERRRLGASVAVSGDTAFVGAPGTGASNEEPGATYVFVRTDGLWTQGAKLVAPDPVIQQAFGAAVTLAQDTAVIGASGDDDRGEFAGAAYVFVRAAAAWTQQAKVVASDGKANDFFGSSAALEGNTVAIGTHTSGGVDGKAYVFSRSATAWTEQVKIVPPATGDTGGYGGAVALSGDRVLVGAPADSDKGPGSGAAYAYDLSPAP